MADDIDQLLQLFGFGGLGLSPAASQASRTAWSPQIEVRRQNGNLVVRADLPGVAPDDVEVEVDDGVLTIFGERRDEQREERDGFFRTERFYGQFYRAIPLPEGAKEDRVEAKFDNGVLEIRMPVAEQDQRQRRRVAITSGPNGGAGNRQQERPAATEQGGKR
jgi:HSP20 family protein